MTDEPAKPTEPAPSTPKPEEPEAETVKLIDFDTFLGVDLRTAEVISAEAHPNADRLLVLRVRLGDEERQLVAGIKGHYELEDLVGRTVVVVANLKPARLRGVDSQGMILAVRDGDRVILVSPESPSASGLRVS